MVDKFAEQVCRRWHWQFSVIMRLMSCHVSMRDGQAIRHAIVSLTSAWQATYRSSEKLIGCCSQPRSTGYLGLLRAPLQEVHYLFTCTAALPPVRCCSLWTCLSGCELATTRIIASDTVSDSRIAVYYHFSCVVFTPTRNAFKISAGALMSIFPSNSCDRAVHTGIMLIINSQ